MYVLLTNRIAKRLVQIGIDDEQQLHQIKQGLAPEVSYSIHEVDISQLMADYGKPTEDKQTLSCFQLEPLISYKNFRLRCTSDKSFKALWAPHLV